MFYGLVEVHEYLFRELAVSMENRKITVYVKSTKTKRIKKVRMPSKGSRAKAAAAGAVPFLATVLKDYRKAYLGEEEEEKVVSEYTLPHGHRKVIDLVKNAAKRYEYTVEIVDIAKENIIIRNLLDEIEGIDTFPTVETNLGSRLEGPQITKENIELLLLDETQQR